MQEREIRQVVLFPGSFNPLHIGHLIIAEALADVEGVDEVWIVPTPQNPFKQGRQLMDDALRLQMAQASVDGNPRLRICDVEMHLPRPNYTINTILELERQHPDTAFSLAIGGDNLAGFHQWHRSNEILEHCPLIVYPRMGEVCKTEGQPRVHLLQMPIIEISSTMIRQRIAEGRSIRYLVPEAVRLLLQPDLAK